MPDITVSKTIAALGDYTAGDVISESASAGTSWAFTPVLRHFGSQGVAVHAIMTCTVEAMVPRCSLDLFTSDPSASTLNDNVAASIAAADKTKHIGTLHFEPLSDRGAVSEAEAFGYLPFAFPNQVKTLYGILRTLDSFTNEAASMVITIRLTTEPVG